MAAAILLLLAAFVAAIPAGAPTGMLVRLFAAVRADPGAYQIVASFPHDPGAFTQGLVVHGGSLYESTGLYGRSSLREVDGSTGRVLRRIDLPPQYFAEGMTILNDRVYQLTWREHTGFIYDLATFSLLGTWSYDGEGWGLTHDGSRLLMSDGTSRIRFLDPATLVETGSVEVADAGVPVSDLNELEMVNGELYANVWRTDRIVRVDPATGAVLGWIDLAGLLPSTDRTGQEDVLNGIAYDAERGRLLVTGKLWPRVFEIRLPS